MDRPRRDSSLSRRAFELRIAAILTCLISEMEAPRLSEMGAPRLGLSRAEECERIVQLALIKIFFASTLLVLQRITVGRAARTFSGVLHLQGRAGRRGRPFGG